MTVVLIPPHRRVAASGDADVSLAPRPNNGGHVIVLHYTPTEGRPTAVTLSRDELQRIRVAADRILTATPDDIDGWLDDAAHDIQQHHRRSGPFFGRGPA